MQNKIIVIGGGGAGQIAASIIDRNKEVELLGFLNDFIPVGDTVGSVSKKLPVIGNLQDIPKYLQDPDISFFVAFEGITNPYKSYEVLKSLPIPENRYYTIIDKTAIIPYEYCKIGYGVMFAPLSQLSPDTIISNNCILLGNCFVGHDTVIDEFSHITSNSVVGSNVHIGKGVTVGLNSTIRERCRIGDFSLIGAGSVVLEDVPPYTIVAGNPARVLRERGELNYIKKPTMYETSPKAIG